MNPDDPPRAPTSGEALVYWLRLGCIGFGGPAGQIALMHEELVVRRRWISERRFLHALDYCMVLPGPEAQQLATYLGWLIHGIRGGLVAGGLFVLPSFFVLVALSAVYMAYGHVPAIAGAFYGIKPAVTAIVAFAAWRIGSRVLRNGWLRTIAALSFVSVFAFAVPFPAIVIVAGVVGLVGGRLAPERFAGGVAHRNAAGGTGRALVDDDTPTPAHARFSWPRLARVTAVSVLLWGAAVASLAVVLGVDGELTRMGWFFTKAAFLTFGGAYAVLPYVFQGAVEQYGWLSASQMIDGLALGETTPGPLIMVVAFVGFVGGWSKAVLGPDAQLIAGVAGAGVATFFTFLPSFFFIFAGGPLIETTHGDLRFTAPLTAISAAVVGVIVDLAVFFAYHVLWPAGPAAPFEWRAAAIGLAAAIALFRYGIGVIPVVIASAVAGLVVTFAR